MNNFSLFGLKSAVIFSVLFLLSGCDKLNSPKTQKNQTESTSSVTQSVPKTVESYREKLIRGIRFEPVLEPWQVKEEEQLSLIRDLFEGLTAYDEQGNIVPAAAESWQTQDNKIWRFVLREGLMWSNGEPLTAQDFVFSWQTLSQSQTPLKSYLLYLNLKNAKSVLDKKQQPENLGISAENDRTLLISLDKPTPYLPEMLVHIALLPQYQGAKAQVSNGAYMFSSRDGNGVHLVKNPYYWKKENVSFKRVDYVPYDGEETLSRLDVVWDIGDTTNNIQYFPKLCGYFYEFNLRDPKLSNPLVRKAIASRVSVVGITHNEMPNGIPSSYFLPKAMLQGADSRWEPVVAEQLLAKANITEKQPLILQLSYDDSPLHRSIANRLAQQLSESDLLRPETQSMSWQQLQEKRVKGEFQLVRSGWCGDFNHPMAFLGLFYSKSPDNKSGYVNPQYDKLFEQALKSASEKERSEIYLKLSEIIQQENIVLPLFQYTTPVYIAPSIMGAKQNPIGSISSKDLWRKVEITE
ncbi:MULTISPECIES: peptide ABC transporter substrate-binding protein [Rodentibacter]|uniref:peptide ABC transporter substrate-binding protein n=1 Tax=Rodentibacter TaxID=1960084 RepID=UPI001CFDD4D1|nr:peptide ABC transporter substrate-binding protein [Rodentibacter sp. JRC1]GJI56354.1 putative binding protein [Rodentibacter sp. JRC1]